MFGTFITANCFSPLEVDKSPPPTRAGRAPPQLDHAGSILAFTDPYTWLQI